MQVSGPRDETQEERDDRNLIELLQELRVAGLGVQVLFGFLLALPFSSRFVQLGHWQRALYVGILVVSAVATALLLGPVAYHRLVFRRRQKEHLVRAADVMAIGEPCLRRPGCLRHRAAGRQLREQGPGRPDHRRLHGMPVRRALVRLPVGPPGALGMTHVAVSSLRPITTSPDPAR